MTTVSKKLTACLLSVVMLLGILLLTEPAYAAGLSGGDSMASAAPIALNTSYSDSTSLNQDSNWYRVTLSSSGRITINVSSNLNALYVRLYSSDADQLWYEYCYRDNITGRLALKEPLDLTKGTYYLCVERYSTSENYIGAYTFGVDFTSAGESFTETGSGVNNTYPTASSISLNKTYTGQLAFNDEYDWYRFTLPSSGRISLTLSSKLRAINVGLYDSAGERLWYEYCSQDTSTGQIEKIDPTDLTKGTYYLCVERYSNYPDYTGKYTLKASFTSAGESFTETGSGNNNTTAAADSVSLGVNYKGQIAFNDDMDFYKFKMPAKGKLNLYIKTKMNAVAVRFYDRSGNQIFADTAYKNSTTGTNRAKFTVAVPAGTGYVGVTQSGSNTGTYTFSVQRDGVPTAPQVTSSYQSTSGKPYLKWASVEYASKYEVYRATSKTGTYKKIATTSKASYTDTSAATGYTYYYKVKAVSSKGSASGYSAAVSTISHCARPVAKSDYLTSTGKPYVKWSAVTGASKYQVYRSTSKTGTYKLLGTTTKLNYTDTSATTGYTYYYKVKAVSKVKTSANSAYSTPISIICHCAKPAVKITTTSSGDPKLTWSTVTGASKYEVYRATSSGGTYTKVATTTAKTYTDKTAKAGKTYYYKVKAVSKVKTSANSAYSAVKSIKAK